MIFSVAPRFEMKVRRLKIGRVTLRTVGKHISLSEQWLYRDEMLALAELHGVNFIDLRPDKFQAFARVTSITINSPTAVERLRKIAHECCHISCRHAASNMTRHPKTGTHEIAHLRSIRITPDADL